MKASALVLATAVVLPTTALAAAAEPALGRVGASAPENAVVHDIGWKRRDQRSVRDCTPYNGPYGYYGNPYCEGGFSRYGKAGGYEIDLTPYFEESYWRDRRGRRWR